MVFKKGNKPWNAGISTIPWNKGRKCPQISNSNKGRMAWNKGLKGVQVAWNKGIKASNETRQKISKSKIKSGIQIYRRIAYQYYSNQCCKCKSINNLIVHHIDYNRYNNEVKNLQILCRSCHKKLHDFEKYDQDIVNKQWEETFEKLLK